MIYLHQTSYDCNLGFLHQIKSNPNTLQGINFSRFDRMRDSSPSNLEEEMTKSMSSGAFPTPWVQFTDVTVWLMSLGQCGKAVGDVPQAVSGKATVEEERLQAFWLLLVQQTWTFLRLEPRYDLNKYVEIGKSITWPASCILHSVHTIRPALLIRHLRNISLGNNQHCEHS